jgi:hypothetical protein
MTTTELFQDGVQQQNKTTNKKHMIHIKIPPRDHGDHSEVMLLDKVILEAWASSGDHAMTPPGGDPDDGEDDDDGKDDDDASMEEDAMEAWAAGDAMTPQEAFHQIEHRDDRHYQHHHRHQHHQEVIREKGLDLAAARRHLEGHHLLRRRVGRETLRKEHKIA